MRVAFIIIASVACLSVSCRREKTAPISSVSDTEIPQGDRVVSLEYLEGHQEGLVDQEVNVAAYLCTHEEGPWIASNPRIPFKFTMSLEITDSSEIVSKDLSQRRWWFEAQDGFPVILSGVFRWRDKKRPFGEIEKNHPCIEVSIAKEVERDDPVWVDAINKNANKP